MNPNPACSITVQNIGLLYNWHAVEKLPSFEFGNLAVNRWPRKDSGLSISEIFGENKRWRFRLIRLDAKEAVFLHKEIEVTYINNELPADNLVEQFVRSTDHITIRHSTIAVLQASKNLILNSPDSNPSPGSSMQRRFDVECTSRWILIPMEVISWRNTGPIFNRKRR